MIGRKEHKFLCKEIKNETSDSRDPVMKLAERISRDEEVMGWIDAIAAKTLDLLHHPENASKYAVLLYARAVADPGVKSQASSKVPKTLELIKTARLEDAKVPAGLTDTAQGMRASFGGTGGWGEPLEDWQIIRLAWISEHTPLATVYVARYFNRPMLEFIEERKMPGPRGLLVPTTPQWLIEYVMSFLAFRSLEVADSFVRVGKLICSQSFMPISNVNLPS